MSHSAVDPAEQDNPDLEAQQQPERPDWLPDNFNDPRDLVKSYEHARAEMTRAQQEAAAERQARENYEQIIAEQQAERQQYQQQQHTQDIYAQIEQAREVGDIRAETNLQAQLVAQQLQQQYQQQQQPALPQDFVADYADKALAATYPDWQEHRANAVSLIQANQFLLPDDATTNPASLAKALDIAYRAVKADAVAASPPQPNDLTQQKLAAQTISGAGVRQPAPTDNEEWARRITEANKHIGGFSAL